MRRAAVLILFLAVFASPALAQQESSETENLIRLWHEAPAVPYVSEQEQNALRRDFQKGEVLLTARLGAVMLADIGFGGAPIPMTRIFLEDLHLETGPKPDGESFLSRETPDALKAAKGQEVIVVLNRADEKSRTLMVTRMVPADKGSLQLLIEAIRARQQKPGAEDCSKPEADVCPA